MGKVFAEIDDKLASWIRGQQMFFVATESASEADCLAAVQVLTDAICGELAAD